MKHISEKEGKSNSLTRISTPVIIPAAGPPRPQVLALSSAIKSASMVPVSGKPVLGWILDNLIDQGFSLFIVLSIMGDEQIDQYCEWRYKNKRVRIITIPVESVNSYAGVGHSIFKALCRLPDYNLL